MKGKVEQGGMEDQGTQQGPTEKPNIVTLKPSNNLIMLRDRVKLTLRQTPRHLADPCFNHIETFLRVGHEAPHQNGRYGIQEPG